MAGTILMPGQAGWGYDKTTQLWLPWKVSPLQTDPTNNEEYGILSTYPDVQGLPGHVFKPIKNIAITAGTPVSVWTPASGKKFRLMGFLVYYVSGANESPILFEDATGGANEFLRYARANTTNASPLPVSLFPYGYLSTTVNNQLFLDVTVNGNVEGYVYGNEE